MNKIFEKMIDDMFDKGLVKITERTTVDDMLIPTSFYILDNEKVLCIELPSYLTGEEQLQTVIEIIKDTEKGNLFLPDDKKLDTIKVCGFLLFFEAWVSSEKSNIGPTYAPDRQTALCVIAGDVDGYYNGMQTVSPCNGKSVVGDRKISHFNFNENCTGRLGRVLKESNLKFKKMDDDTMSKVIKEMI